jgi:hypothetical protein
MAVVTFHLMGGLRPWVEANPFMTPPVTWGLSGLAFLAPRQPWVGLGAAFLLGGAARWLLQGEGGAITPRRTPVSNRASALIHGALAGAAAFPVLFPLSLPATSAWIAHIQRASSARFASSRVGRLPRLRARFLHLVVQVNRSGRSIHGSLPPDG